MKSSNLLWLCSFLFSIRFYMIFIWRFFNTVLVKCPEQQVLRFWSLWSRCWSWFLSDVHCVRVSVGDRTDAKGVQMEFKSNQWFGASVRSNGEHILVTHTQTHTPFWTHPNWVGGGSCSHINVWILTKRVSLVIFKSDRTIKDWKHYDSVQWKGVVGTFVCVCLPGVCSSVPVVDLWCFWARAGGNVLPEERNHCGGVLTLQIKCVPLSFLSCQSVEP